jgi:hypothetical protein
MKKLLVLVLVLSSVVMAQAQVQVALGLKAGVNVSKLNTDDVESSSITAFHGGAFGLFKFTAIGIQPELLFSQQGTTIDDVSLGKGDLKMSYMTIPVMIKFYLPGGFNLQAGPQFGFLNSAEFKGDDYKDSFKSSDLSANVGVAWDAPFGLVLDARYNIGLSDINDGDDFDGEIKSGIFQFSLGYKIFKIGK